MEQMSEAMKERALQRAAELEGEDQSFEARLARSLESVNRTLAPRIDALRLVGPPMPDIVAKKYPTLVRKRSSADMTIAHCIFCSPPPKTYTCVLCDWETPDHWRMKMHTELNPRWCQERAAKKARRWSRYA